MQIEKSENLGIEIEIEGFLCLDRVIRTAVVNNFPINFVILVPLANADQ